MKNVYRGVLLAIIILCAVVLATVAQTMEPTQVPSIREGFTDQSLVCTACVFVTIAAMALAVIREVEWP